MGSGVRHVIHFVSAGRFFAEEKQKAAWYSGLTGLQTNDEALHFAYTLHIDEVWHRPLLLHPVLQVNPILYQLLRDPGSALNCRRHHQPGTGSSAHLLLVGVRDPANLQGGVESVGRCAVIYLGEAGGTIARYSEKQSQRNIASEIDRTMMIYATVIPTI